ncbi:MAG: DUF6492 family protein, partial [Verrucomicrobia bacterium]|nr:DUF6492 family protein [Verrucomicrobiota bacterium]
VHEEPENKMILYRTGQHHLPYFKTFTKLFGFSPEKQKSFIANYMLMNARIVQEMTRQIEDETDKRWHEVILEAIDRNTMSSFSEYETYGYFLSRFYPESFVSERSATLNLFSFLYPFHDLIQQLARARFHSIAYHNYRR